MPTFGSIFAPPAGAGLLYALNTVITSTEADLHNQSPPNADPAPVRYEQAISAIVEITMSSTVLSHSTYIVMQTDWGDGVWVDVAWLNYSSLGPATFVLAGGVAGANSFQQTRAAGTAPSPANSSRQFPLGDRIRFVGKTTSVVSGSSSSSSGVPAAVPQVRATIRYKGLGLR